MDIIGKLMSILASLNDPAHWIESSANMPTFEHSKPRVLDQARARPSGTF